LLVSVRSAAEAAVARASGAEIIDVKEPDAGPLGRASSSVWQEVCSAISDKTPVSVALGELNEWRGSPAPLIPNDAWSGIAYRKLGLAGVGPDWRASWRRLREALGGPPRPDWIAVAYADWQRAGAPHPEAVLDAACESEQIAGVLLDTWDKTNRLRVTARLAGWAAQVRHSGKLLAVAGGLEPDRLAELDGLVPDIVAVRGAACVDGNRRATIDPQRVRNLARLVAQLPDSCHAGQGAVPGRVAASNFTPWASGRSLP
jgi:uncharacterized protein (UPF0264 family)